MHLPSMARDHIPLCVTYVFFVKICVSHEARNSTAYNTIIHFLDVLFNKAASY
jgi:hypothetical protein